MNRSARLAALVLAVFLYGACSSDSSNPVDGNGDDGITYADDIQPIFSTSCSGAMCHIGETTSGVNLSGFTQVRASFGTQYGGLIVVAGDADASPIIDKVTGTPPQFGVRMPNGRPALSAGQIQALRTWIDEGALNN